MWGATLVLFAALFLTEEAPAHPDLTEAQDMIAHAIEEDPENAALYLRRGTLETKRRDWDAAAASWLKAASLGADRNITDVALATALRPGGRLILEAYTPDQIGRGTGGPPVPELTMDLARLDEELVGLEFEHRAEFVRPVIEGPGHTGDGAVVQVIARRPG